MKGRYYEKQADNLYRIKTLNKNCKTNAEDQEDGKRAIISVSIILAFFFFYTIIVMISNNI